MINIELSIVILNYKSWGKLDKCLESFKKFSPECSYEIIVVDNYSNDGQFSQYKEKYSQLDYIKFIENAGNYGFSNGCNLGAKKSVGECILFLNPDTLITDNQVIDKMLNFQKKHDNVGIVSCSKISENGKKEREVAFLNPWLTIGLFRSIYKIFNKKLLNKKYNNCDNIWYPEWIGGSVVLISKELFNNIGCFDESSYWMYFEDVDLCKKVRDKGLEVSLLRDVTITHLHGASSRINPTVTAMTKSEVIISSHMFVNNHTTGFNRVLLHIVIAFKSLATNIIELSLLSLVFWKPKFKAKKLLLQNLFQYYMKVLTTNSWLSPRIK